jgi:DNA-binding XRE family transcriptional regulator
MDNRLKEYRTKRKLTQVELAAAATTSQQSIQRVEAGAVPMVHLAVRLARVLKVEVDTLFPEEQDTKRKKAS